VQLPSTDTPPVSGPLYVPPPEHPARPEVASSPETETATGRLYQPSLSGPRSGVALTAGGEESFRTITVEVTEPDPSDAVHETPVPPVSWVTVVAAHAWDHDTVTFPVCQAPQSAGPGEQDGCGAAGIADVELGTTSAVRTDTATTSKIRCFTVAPPAVRFA
jgi:hypothetical protein